MRIVAVTTQPRTISTNYHSKPTVSRSMNGWPGDSIRKSITVMDRMIAERDIMIVRAKRDRVVARRLCWVMSIATVVSSVAVLCSALVGLAPLAAAFWVVPSAFGGSAVAQAAVALQASERIRIACIEREALAAARGVLLAELRYAQLKKLHEVQATPLISPNPVGVPVR